MIGPDGRLPAVRPSASGLLTAWGSWWLGGRCPLADAVRALEVAGGPQRVHGLGGRPMDLARALPALRAAGVVRLRLHLPRRTRLTAAQARDAFTDLSTRAGQGVLAVRDDMTGLGLVPVTGDAGTVWTSVELPVVPPWTGPYLLQAEAQLRRVEDELSEATGAAGAMRSGGRFQLLMLGGVENLEVLRDQLPPLQTRTAYELLLSSHVLRELLPTAPEQPSPTTAQRQGRRGIAAMRRVADDAEVAAYNSFAEAVTRA